MLGRFFPTIYVQTRNFASLLPTTHEVDHSNCLSLILYGYTIQYQSLINFQILSLGKTSLAILLLVCLQPLACFALPPPEDVPEEILRTEIILEGRSPVDGKPLSASEYEELQATLRESRFDPQINEDIQQLIFLLQIRKLIQTIIPFY